MTQTELQRWVIAGQGAGAWMAAAILSNTLDSRVCSIVVCGREEPAPVTKQQAMLPHFLDLLATLGVDRESFIRDCHGHYKLADQLRGWQKKGADFYHATGDYGAKLGAVEFVQTLGRLRAENTTLAPLEAYSLAATCAQSGKFVPSTANRSSILSSYEYGCSLSVPDLVQWLKTYCRNRGVRSVNCEVAEVSVSSNTACIESVQLGNGDTVLGDFYIDATENAVLHSFLGSSVEDWSNQLPTEVAYHLESDQSDSAPVVTLIASAIGWEKQVWSARGSTLSLFGRERDLTPEAIDRWQKSWPGDLSNKTEARTWVRNDPWLGNCLVLGPAALSLPSPAFSELDLTWLTLRQLLKHFPMRIQQPALSEEFNRVMMEVYGRCRDLTQMYFLVADQSRGEFWHTSANADCSSDLNHKVGLFRSVGRIAFYEHEIFDPKWQAYLLLGLGVWPEKVDPLAWHADPKALEQLCQKVQKAVSQAAQQLPEHNTYLQQECRQNQSATPNGV